MADYYPLLARAVANLATNEVDTRQAIYARARDALERQLQSLDPALPDEDILKERLALEDVIRRIEREQASAISGGETSPEETPATKIAGDEKPTEGTAGAEASAETSARGEVAPPALLAQPHVSAPPNLPAPPRTERPKIRPSESTLPTEPSPFAEATVAPSGHAGTSPPESEAVATTRGMRISMPQEDNARRRAGRLGVLAVVGLAVMVGMGALALTTREGPERYREPVRIEAPAPPVDQTKREGRLAAVDAPEAAPRPAAPIEPVAPQPPAPEAPRQPPAVAQTPPAAPPVALPGPVLPIVGRAFMILEVPGAPPNQYEGQSNWSFAAEAAGKPGDKIVRLQAEFVAAGLSVDFTLARNSDATLSASHTIFVAFEPKPGLPAVREMGAIEWRERETQSGSPLVGVLVPIQDNAFMIGLDKSEAALNRNLDLLQSQKWMVFEVRFANNRRGAFLIEKGSAGEKAIADALSAWK